MTTRRTIVNRAVVLTAIAALATTSALSGCGSPSSSTHADAAHPSPNPFAHVHGIAMDGDAVLLATHAGLYRQDGREVPVRLSDQPFDVMGFTVAGDRLLASGHPAPGTDLPPDLGLGQSTDGGRTWQSVSLLGEVDFHRLRAQGSQVWGISAADGALLTSADSGRTWTSLGTPGLYDIAVHPADPTVLVGTTEAGPVLSTDGGRTFIPLEQVPVLGLLAWADTGLYGITPSGTVMHSKDGRTGWTRRATVTGEPEALWAHGTRLAVATSSAVSVSEDGGQTFTEQISIP